jgi:hypothetical protein
MSKTASSRERLYILRLDAILGSQLLASLIFETSATAMVPQRKLCYLRTLSVVSIYCLLSGRLRHYPGCEKEITEPTSRSRNSLAPPLRKINTRRRLRRRALCYTSLKVCDTAINQSNTNIDGTPHLFQSAKLQFCTFLKIPIRLWGENGTI